MPRFYFDSNGGGQPAVTDDVGLVFLNQAGANAHAMSLLPVMGVELPLSAGEFRTWTSSVRDENGSTVARFIMAIINDDCGSGGVKILSPMA